MAIVGVGFFDVKRTKDAVKVLHVGHIPAEADYSCIVERAETLHVSEAGEGAIGSYTPAELVTSSSLIRRIALGESGLHGG